jgi:hypothetical protein
MKNKIKGLPSKYDFMEMVESTFETCNSDEEIEQKATHMTFIVENQKELAKRYLKLGILEER